VGGRGVGGGYQRAGVLGQSSSFAHRGVDCLEMATECPDWTRFVISTLIRNLDPGTFMFRWRPPGWASSTLTTLGDREILTRSVPSV
jgi:hypothetical protein